MNFREDTELKEFIRRLALLNAIKHDGKALAGPVIRKVLAEKPELRSKAKEIADFVEGIIREVSGISLREQECIVKDRWPESLVKKEIEEEKALPCLPNVEKYTQVVTRFSPNPDCVLHLGSARAIVLCYEYAHKYEGKFILRFEDTDPKKKKPILEFYDHIRKDLEWLKCRPDEEHIQSDRIRLYYKYAEKLIENGNAYVCTCDRERFRECVSACEPCECRDLAPGEHFERWRRMLDGEYKEGEAVVRVKTDLNHPNPAVRDWPGLRIIDPNRHPHPRTGSKYRVWPLYNFACGIDDHLLSVTHIIRGKEHLTNMVRQTYLYRHLGWQYPEAIHYGRLKITGASLSKSKIIKGIQEGLYKSWDDPRLATFAALRKRGLSPEAIKQLIIDVGPKASDVTLSWENLYAHNRKILDPQADRYFFVDSPVQLTVKEIPKVFTAKIRLHPDYPERGFRQYTVEPKGEDNSVSFWISRDDTHVLGLGEIIRLMELFNVKIKKVDAHSVEASFASARYEEARQAKASLIHWISVEADMSCKVIMPNAAIAEGIAENACKQLKPDDIVQFERFGFARVDKVDTVLTAYYAHR